MDQAALDMLVRYAGYFFLGGFTVGLIVKLLVGKSE
jgi:hypothetical protein